MSYTKGPWYVSDCSDLTLAKLGFDGEMIDTVMILDRPPNDIGSGHGCVIARIKKENRPDKLDESDVANGHLIAAAPEMLDVLEHFSRYFTSGNKVPVSVAMIKSDAEVVKEMWAAIRKAKGKTNA